MNKQIEMLEYLCWGKSENKVPINNIDLSWEYDEDGLVIGSIYTLTVGHPKYFYGNKFTSKEELNNYLNNN